MLTDSQTRLAVWGDPIAHSRSPRLHAAAYDVLGLPWDYERRRVADAGFADALAELDGTWRALSLTMPLKGVAFASAGARDRRAELTGAVNTLLLDPAGTRGFNTDIGGIVGSLRDEGIDSVDHARIIGSGATATSALVALQELGATRVEVVARRPAAVAGLQEIGAHLGMTVVPVALGSTAHTDVAVTIATLPGDAVLPEAVSDALATSGGLLLDVVYGHWPTSLASAWHRAEAPAVSGLGMLLYQAVLQVRAFVTGDVTDALDEEDRILDAMRQALAT